MKKRKSRPARYLAIGLVGVVSILAGLVYWSGSGGGQYRYSARHRPRGVSPSSTIESARRYHLRLAVIPHVERSVKRAFSLFTSIPEPLPPEVRAILRVPQYGMNWDLAQKLPGARLRGAWLVPGNGTLCILYKLAGGSRCPAPLHSALYRMELSLSR